MNHRFTTACAAIALYGATGVAWAQTYTLMAPPLTWARQYFCTLTNVSNQSVMVLRVEIVEKGKVYWDGSTSCTGTLPAGKHCITRTAASVVDPRLPYCRAQYTGAEGAVVGSFDGDFQYHVGGSPHGTVTAIPLQAVKTFTLATAN